MNNNKSNLVQIGALWQKESRDGKNYFSGSMGDSRNGLQLILRNSKGEEVEITKLVVFQNEKKTQENHPDWRMLVSVE